MNDVSLSYSSLPYKGVVQITIDGETKNVCWGGLDYWSGEVVCRHLGYDRSYSVVNVSIPRNAKEATFSGSINYNSDAKFLSQCSISASSSRSCLGLSYIKCTGKETSLKK